MPTPAPAPSPTALQSQARTQIKQLTDERNACTETIAKKQARISVIDAQLAPLQALAAGSAQAPAPEPPQA
jgi:hypothetical protein